MFGGISPLENKIQTGSNPRARGLPARKPAVQSICMYIYIYIYIYIHISGAPRRRRTGRLPGPGTHNSPASRRGQDKRFCLNRSDKNSHMFAIKHCSFKQANKIMVYCGTSAKTPFILTPFGSCQMITQTHHNHVCHRRYKTWHVQHEREQLISLLQLEDKRNKIQSRKVTLYIYIYDIYIYI